jgi:hypothetical protein
LEMFGESLGSGVVVPCSYDTGSHAWSTTGSGPASRSYRVSWQFTTDGMTQQQVDALQGSSVTADVVWEFRSTPVN